MRKGVDIVEYTVVFSGYRVEVKLSCIFGYGEFFIKLKSVNKLECKIEGEFLKFGEHLISDFLEINKPRLESEIQACEDDIYMKWNEYKKDESYAD